MKMEEAMQIMEKGVTNGFMVIFERVDGGLLYTDYFPDVFSGESPIASEEEAWEMAVKFAAKTRKRYVNLYVAHSESFGPVRGYKERMIQNR